MREFFARAVAATEVADANAFVLVLAEEEDGGGRRLEIQHAIEFDSQDRELGQATYCLVTDDGAAVYGGVSSWNAGNGALHIALHQRAVEVLGTDGFVVRYSPQHDGVLQMALRRLFSS